MWRKTRVPYNMFCFGADPNRNWAYFWNSGGASALPCSETFRGPSAFSEPSTSSLSEFIGTIAHRLVAYISFHSFSQMLLIPYGYTTAHLDNYNLTVSNTKLLYLCRQLLFYEHLYSSTQLDSKQLRHWPDDMEHNTLLETSLKLFVSFSTS